MSISLYGHEVDESWQGVLTSGLQTLQTFTEASVPTLVNSVIATLSRLFSSVCRT